MSSKKIVLTSSDDECFEIDEAVARKMQMVAHMIDDDCADKAIRLQNVTGKILAIIIEYCKKHVDDVEAKNEFVTWDAEFVKNIDMDTLFKLLHAADYLIVIGLKNLIAQAIADYTADKTVNEIRELFNIENDYTPEEEEELRKKNEWAFN
ncbi:SKP1-like protein 17 [Arabidopsis thaliana]|uniref:SKP1-like protein n=2 Tax=Arabidopsis TaxID=3701 RepID=A0A178W3I4_ARATH|nr:SKP1/BTB/POZ domain superfamily [Arabidopsis thaliana x Arabidopsis arenosa]OAP11672.1 MEO [Arabidopsis thaliana]